jgi:DNA helicase-2/ATP-dependent DNA helicase PcrA
VDESESQSEDKLTLMTVHSAKGLEFKVVFVVGMEENLFPSQMSMDSVRGLEEERRLFYVAITRAEEYLLITNAKSRFRYGKTEFCEPSRFLREIDPRFLRVKGSTGGVSVGSSPVRSVPTGLDARRFVRVSPVRSAEPQQVASSANVPVAVAVGTRVRHERFGIGTVTAIEGSGMDTKATVNFDNAGTKQLLLRFAKITVL